MKRNTIIVFISIWILLIGFRAQLPVKEFPDLYLGSLLKIDHSGNIYTNYKFEKIVKYSPEGEELLTIGQMGKGPGGFMSLSCFALNPKDLLLYAAESGPGNKWISTFSPNDGSFVKIFPCKLDRKKWPSIKKMQFDHQGNIYIQAENIQEVPLGENIRVICEEAIFKFDHSGNNGKEIFRTKFDEVIRIKGRFMYGVPFRTNLSWAILRDKLILRQNHLGHIAILNLDGTPSNKLPLPFEEVLVTKKEIEKWARSSSKLPFIIMMLEQMNMTIEQFTETLPFPKYKAICQGPMYWGPDNTVYCQKKPEIGNKKGDTWAVISLDSGKSKIYKFAPKHHLVAIKGNFFYFVVLDEDNERILTIYDHQHLPIQKN